MKGEDIVLATLAMDYLQFANPTALWALFLTPVLAWVLRRAARRRREAVEAFTSAAVAERLVVGPSGNRERFRDALLVGVVVLLIVAAARPRLGVKLERVQRRGADLLVAIDTSDSMLAQDATPSRLEAAKREILGLISRLQGDRIGLITFSTQAFLYCPLTVDYDAAAVFVESIDATVTSGAGTALAPALREAERAFSGGEGGERVVVLVSDGEDWGQGARDAARSLRSHGIRLYSIGIGTEEGAPVPVYDERGNLAGMREYEGKVVLSRLNEAGLQELAKLGNGKYFKGGTADHAAAAIYEEVASLQSARQGEYRFRGYAERFQWPVGAALLLLGTEFLMRAYPPRRRKANSRTAIGVVVVLCFLTTSGFSLFETPARLCRAANRLFAEGKFAEALRKYVRALELDPGSPILRFNSGDALYRQGDYDKAREEFARAAAAGDLALKAKAYYNTGNCYLAEKELDAAIEAYKNALRCDPTDRLAKRNLEIALRMKQRQPAQRNEPQDDQRRSKPKQQAQKRQNTHAPDERQAPEQPQPPQALPMTPEEARALLRQAANEDAQVRRQVTRMAPPAPEAAGKDW